MQSTRSCFLLALTMLASLPVLAQTHTLKIATGELPLCMTAARAVQGIPLSVVRRAFELADYQVKYIFLPWSRALAETRLGKWDATAAWGNNPERNPHFLSATTWSPRGGCWCTAARSSSVGPRCPTSNPTALP